MCPAMFSIPDLASQIVEQSLKQSEVNENSHTLFFVGSKSCGKTTLIYSLLERSGNPNETLVLEYYFGRRTSQKQGIEKSICHIWEYGGKLENVKNVLPSIQGNFYYCVMVDMSKIKTIWDVLETSLLAIKDKYSDTHKPIVVIIGAKYDLFQNFDSEIKKFICTTLRSVALIFEAHLYTYSSKDAALARRLKDILNSMGFGSSITVKEKNTSYTKPLTIPKGTDSWESIGVSSSTFEQVKLRHVSRITSQTAAPIDLTGPQRTHSEPVIDSLLAAKYEELRNMTTFDFSIDEYIMNLV